MLLLARLAAEQQQREEARSALRFLHSLCAVLSDAFGGKGGQVASLQRELLAAAGIAEPEKDPAETLRRLAARVRRGRKRK